jgi:dihydropyrimidinase
MHRSTLFIFRAPPRWKRSSARESAQEIYVETRPVYLYLTRERYEEPDGAKSVTAPPLRERSDVDALWHGLRSGAVDTFCSDHAPWTLALKLDPELTLGSYRAGVSNLETLMPMLYSEGVRKGRISLIRWVELTSTNPAKLFGMFPQKGAIAVGSDADLVVWDSDRRRTIRASEMRSNAGYDVYEGREIHGWPAYTISRGDIVFEDGKIIGARGRGRRVRRGPCMPL